MPNTTHFKNMVSGALFGKSAVFNVPDTYYLAVSTTQASEDGTNFTEPTDPTYSRVPIVNSSASFSDPDNGTVVNKQNIEFPESSKDWGSIKSTGIFDSERGGNLLMYDHLDPPKMIERETVFLIKPGSLSIVTGDCPES